MVSYAVDRNGTPVIHVLLKNTLHHQSGNRIIVCGTPILWSCPQQPKQQAISPQSYIPDIHYPVSPFKYKRVKCNVRFTDWEVERTKIGNVIQKRLHLTKNAQRPFEFILAVHRADNTVWVGRVNSMLVWLQFQTILAIMYPFHHCLAKN